MMIYELFTTFAPANSESPMHSVNVVRSDEGGLRWQDVILNHSSKHLKHVLRQRKEG